MRETFEETGVRTGNIFSYYSIRFTRRGYLSVKCHVNLNYFLKSRKFHFGKSGS